jgi:hypothetical protein
MISFPYFTPAANDASLQYLGTIFGNVNGVIPMSGGTMGGTITILGTMFRTFNSIALAIGAFIVIYITIVGTMMTAHEGEFMKKWNSIWTPIRATIGIAALVPTASGFSGIQIIMMWVIVQGVGAADTLWNTVLGYVNFAGSPYAQITPNSTGVDNTIGDLFKAITCDETARQTYPPPDVIDPQTGAYYCGPGNPCFNSALTIDPSQTTSTSFQFGPGGACGTLTYCNQSTSCTDSTSLGCMTCTAQVPALATMITTLRDAADIFIKADYDYQNYYYNGFLAPNKPNPKAKQPSWLADYCTANNIPSQNCTGPIYQAVGTVNIPTQGSLSLPDPGGTTGNAPNSVIDNLYWPFAMQPTVGNNSFVTTATNYYMNAVGQALTAYIAQQVSNTNSLSGALADAQKTGWIFAGAYYYTITKINSSNTQQALPALSMAPTDPSSQATNPLNSYRNNFQAADELIKAMNGTSSLPGGEAQAALSNGASAINGMLISATASSGTSTNSPNPLVQLAAAGYGLLFAAQIIFAVFMIVALVIGLVSGINVFVLGTGGFNPMAVSSPILFMILVPLLFALLGVMVSMGATLGVYVPLIPYMIFTFGAIGWLTSTIETMVAGPLVALGILMPGGHHEILGKAEPALMLLFNVFLRPSLMIFGLIAAMLLADVVVTMINAMFFTVMFQVIGAGTNSQGSSGEATAATYAAAAFNPLELVFFLIAYVTLIISALNKCFAAIHIIPEKVMRWINGQGEQYGEGEGMGEVKRAVEGAGASAGAGMKQMKSDAGAGMQQRLEARKKAEEDNKPTLTPSGKS